MEGPGRQIGFEIQGIDMEGSSDSRKYGGVSGSGMGHVFGVTRELGRQLGFLVRGNSSG